MNAEREKINEVTHYHLFKMPCSAILGFFYESLQFICHVNADMQSYKAESVLF